MRPSRVGRNDLCRCGSGKKFKKCCEQKVTGQSRASRVMLIAVAGAVLGAILVGIASFSSDTSGRPRQVWSAEHGHYHDAP
jgi:hypothetical protein